MVTSPAKVPVMVTNLEKALVTAKCAARVLVKAKAAPLVKGLAKEPVMETNLVKALAMENLPPWMIASLPS